MNWRLLAARILVVVVAILAALSILAGYVRYQALDTPTVKNTAGELIADPAIRAEIAPLLVDSLFTNVDVKAALRQKLPPDQQGLAGIVAGGLHQLGDRAAERLLERPRVQAVWVKSVATAHKQLLRLLDDDLTNTSTNGGVVVLNLRPLVIQLGDQIAIVGQLASKLPADAGSIEIMRSDQLKQAQNITHLLDVVGKYLWIVTLLLAALAIWLAEGRRRKILRSLALGIVAAGVLVLVLHRVAGAYIVDALVPPGSTRPAVQQVWDILTSLLDDGAWTAIGLGLIALLGVWLAGESRSGAASRRELAPFLARPAIAYGTAATLFVLLVWWEPTVQTHRWQALLAMAILLGLGVWALARVAAKEHPEARSIPAGQPFERAWARARGRGGGGNDSARVAELERLARLREQGVLTDEELAAEKARLLGAPVTPGG